MVELRVIDPRFHPGRDKESRHAYTKLVERILTRLGVVR